MHIWLLPQWSLNSDSPVVSLNALTPTERTKYREMIGCLMYTTIMTHPDITFAVSTLLQHLEFPRTTHIVAMTHIFHYLLGTKDLKLTLGGTQMKLRDNLMPTEHLKVIDTLFQDLSTLWVSVL